MNDYTFSGVAIAGAAANADVMSWTLRGAASATHEARAARHAMPAIKRPTAAASVASVNRGIT